MRNAAVLLLSLGAAGAAFAQQAPTPVPQTVVAPSLPDEKNKEGTVQPGAAVKSDGGWVYTNVAPIDPNAPKTSSPAAGTPAGAPPAVAPGPGIGVPMPPPPAPGPRGKTVVDSANVTVRGVVKAYEPGVSVTVTEANGKARTVPLAEKAVVYEGIAVGDKVVVRVPLQKPADGKHANLIEKQRPPKAAPPSKFSQAQTPKS